MTNGKPTRVAMIDSITNRNQGGGPKKQGLVPTANYGSMTLLNYQNSGRTTIGYTIGAAIPPRWKLYRAVGSTTRINGTRVFSN